VFFIEKPGEEEAMKMLLSLKLQLFVPLTLAAAPLYLFAAPRMAAPEEGEEERSEAEVSRDR
jgi:hypothetical protein